MEDSAFLPRHHVMSPVARTLGACSIVAAWVFVSAHVGRLALADALVTWWTPALLAAGAALADFVSGLLHWAADTWGRASTPWVGQRFLHPFRVHHVNPDDLLRRDAIDCNGDVAMFTLPFLIAAFFVPPGHFALFLTAFLLTLLPTNQIHQWAHQPHPPRLVARLQRWSLLLNPDSHRHHHREPHTANYCITTGWCNGPLTAIGFFPALERAVTLLTGVEPRADDRAFRAGSDAR